MISTKNNTWPGAHFVIIAVVVPSPRPTQTTDLVTQRRRRASGTIMERREKKERKDGEREREGAK